MADLTMDLAHERGGSGRGGGGEMAIDRAEMWMKTWMKKTGEEGGAHREIDGEQN